MEEYPESFDCLSKDYRKEFIEFISNFRVNYQNILKTYKFNLKKIL